MGLDEWTIIVIEASYMPYAVVTDIFWDIDCTWDVKWEHFCCWVAKGCEPYRSN